MTTTGVRADHRELLLRAYAAFNDRNAEALLALVTADVDWPDDDGGRLHGKAPLRRYWTGQWSRTCTHDEPVGFDLLADGQVAVWIDQVVRTLDGPMITEGRHVHVVRIEGDRIAQLDIETR